MIISPLANDPTRVRVSARNSGRGRADLTLTVAAVGLSVFGAIVVYSATRGADGDQSFVGRQLVFLAAGLVAMIAVSRLDHRRLRSMTPAVLAVTVIALLAVLSPLGTEVRGTRGWLPFGPLSVQPAEFAKVAVVLALVALFTSRRRIADRRRFLIVRFVAGLVVVATLSGLVLAGGETGSVLVYLVAAVGVFVMAGVPKRVLALLFVAAVAAMAIIVSTDVLQPYQRDRLEAFVDLGADPLGAGYNQQQSVTAIGSGGIAGKGLFNGPQTQLRYLPEQQTDFIFAVVSEELGFVGAVAVLLAEGLILWRILAVSRTADDPFGALACIGIFCFLAFQVFQNVAMNLRLMPVTGIPLPFVSYGGSSLLAGFLAVGLVQSVARSRSRPALGVRSQRSGQELYSLGDTDQARPASRLSVAPAR